MTAFNLVLAASLCAAGLGMQIRSTVNQCAPLRNNYVSFSVELCVGTPPQCFDVVADTGSNMVIVPSCLCKNNPSAGCNPDDRCFTGTNASSTFSIKDKPALSQISFGSGSVMGTMATDVVKVGPVKSNMHDGVFLMTNRASLQVNSFEGILGMGVPTGGEEDKKMFFNISKVHRFSMCVQDGTEGALRLNLPPFSKPIRQIGKYHWGLDFRGLSVGPWGSTAKHDLIFCGSDSMKDGMDSPCGMIPDSGTTMIIGPKAQVQMLEESLCAAWPRCTTLAQNESGLSKADAFKQVLADCDRWLHDAHGVYEIPSLYFHVQGKSGGVHNFELTAWAWVSEVQDGSRRMCQSLVTHGADVEGSDYVTKKNGPVWIMGTPLYYEYVVGFDMSSMAVALEKEECHACASARTALWAGAGHLKRTGTPRRFHGEARKPDYDVRLPL